MVIHDLCAAIAAGRQLGALQRIVRSSLGRSGLRESVFWMWHIITFLIYLFQISKRFPSRIGLIITLLLLLATADVFHRFWVAFSFGV